MMICVRLPGTAVLVQRLKARLATAESAARSRLQDTAAAIAEEARARVLAQRSASAGTGSPLAESILVESDGDTVFVTASAPHAPFVEFGTARMAAEPFLGPAFDEARRELAELYHSAERMI